MTHHQTRKTHCPNNGKSGGGAGYSTRKDNGRREGLWLSPACIQAEQTSLFELGGAS